MKELPPGWTRLPEEHLPQPNFWPAGLALGITMVISPSWPMAAPAGASAMSLK